MTLRRWDRAQKLLAKRHPFNNYRLYKKQDIQRFLKTLSQSMATSKR